MMSIQGYEAQELERRYAESIGCSTPDNPECQYCEDPACGHPEWTNLLQIWKPDKNRKKTEEWR
jgi:hypothetical protein